MTPILDVAGLTARHGPRPALRAFDLRIDTPGWWGVVGANGSGKTTLLRCLAGRMAPERGTIRLSGRACEHDPARRAAGVGLTPTLESLPKGISGADLVRLVEQASGGEGDPVAAVIEAALDLDAFWGSYVAELSAGQKQRLAVRLAFAGSPRVVLLDEPFNWLDPAVAHDLKTGLRAITREHGVTVVSALHDIGTLATWCDHGVLMRDGRAVARFSPAELAAARTDLAAFEADLVARVRA
ncbi:ABC transporter ATP-binding protein [Caulobacter sp. 17J65-9]|uniref:ABC transporter ATP-binding protein n=1 Tax=Caulobacter sp. 17J65-9 TaxID=2709382 RepID=UPI0013C5EAA4|nr:ABC transporter ATP-binding protein [Caulobacter sp. 17J65-9]NEX95325.1 ABC transporter ATP-binding protein [Caulobacter sp. 17J65-9]